MTFTIFVGGFMAGFYFAVFVLHMSGRKPDEQARD